MLEDPCIEVSDSLSSRGGIKTLEFQSGTMELDVAEIATRVGPDYSTPIDIWRSSEAQAH